MTIEEYFSGWTKVIDKTELNHVLSVLSKEYLSKSVCPNQTDVFKAFKLCPFEDLKVVFLGQDFKGFWINRVNCWNNLMSQSAAKLQKSIKVCRRFRD